MGFLNRQAKIGNPKRQSFTYRVFLVTPGDPGDFYNDRLKERPHKPFDSHVPTSVATLSEKGGQTMIAIGRGLGLKLHDRPFCVWDGGLASRHRVATELLAESLNKPYQTIPEAELMIEGSESTTYDPSPLAIRMRQRAEAEDITTFVILGSQPVVSRLVQAPVRYGACYELTATSRWHRGRIKLEPVHTRTS